MHPQARYALHLLIVYYEKKKNPSFFFISKEKIREGAVVAFSCNAGDASHFFFDQVVFL
jgi:hypothetical protein